jgi:N-acetylmuramic acid 6-phosphate etherase
VNFDRLETENRNPDTQHLDTLSTMDLVAMIQREDEKVALAVRPTLPQIALAVDVITEALRNGGRLFYIGAGTSGRLGVLDAAECPPTFSTSPEMVQALIAGGPGAMFVAVEGAEDDVILAEKDLRERNANAKDVIVGLAASGRTPYVLGGLRYAAGLGIRTVALVCLLDSELSRVADITIAVPVGPEVIAGSTRMKAGTAQKMVLNMISTAVMVKLGKTYGNLMVDVRATNKKLSARVNRMVREATGVGEEDASAVLELSGGSAKIAIIMLLGKVSATEARRLIEAAHGSVRQTLLVIKNSSGSCC